MRMHKPSLHRSLGNQIYGVISKHGRLVCLVRPSQSRAAAKRSCARCHKLFQKRERGVEFCRFRVNNFGGMSA